MVGEEIWTIQEPHEHGTEEEHLAGLSPRYRFLQECFVVGLAAFDFSYFDHLQLLSVLWTPVSGLGDLTFFALSIELARSTVESGIFSTVAMIGMLELSPECSDDGISGEVDTSQSTVDGRKLYSFIIHEGHVPRPIVNEILPTPYFRADVTPRRIDNSWRKCW